MSSKNRDILWARSVTVPELVFVDYETARSTGIVYTACDGCHAHKDHPRYPEYKQKAIGMHEGVTLCGMHPCDNGMWVHESEAAIMKLEAL